MNKIQLIRHPEFSEIRTIESKEGVLFCAADVCGVLGLTDTKVALRKLDDDEKMIRKVYASGKKLDDDEKLMGKVYPSGKKLDDDEKLMLKVYPSGKKLDDDEKLMLKVSASGQNRDMWFVTESGLYGLILRSYKPEAKKFRKWVTSEVLPSIRRNGYYVHPSYMDKKELIRLGRSMSNELREYIYEEDIVKTGKKFGMDKWDVRDVIIGDRKNNAVMQELQRRALQNRENEINAYAPERMLEVINKLRK